MGSVGRLHAANLASGFMSSYDGGGFEIMLSKNSSSVSQQIETLLDHESPFIDKYTRLVVVMVQTYTVPTNVVLKCELIVEFDSSGAAQPKVQIFSSDRWLNQVIPRYVLLFVSIYLSFAPYTSYLFHLSHCQLFWNL